MFNRFDWSTTELIVVYVCLSVSVSLCVYVSMCQCVSLSVVSWILVKSSAHFLKRHLIGPQLTYFHCSGILPSLSVKLFHYETLVICSELKSQSEENQL